MLIDINASFGGRESIQRFDVATLERELERSECALAFISSNEGTFDQRVANDYLFELCQERDTWLPAASIQPRDTFVWREEIERCRALGVKLFRIDPDESHWPVDSVFLEVIVDRLAGTGAALLVSATHPGLPSAVAERTALAGVPVIFRECRYFPLTELIPLVLQYEHLYVETSRLTSPGGIELSVAELGAGRLLYGSGACRYPAKIASEQLRRANVAADERDAIAWKNASSLLGLAPPPLLTPRDSPSQEEVSGRVERFVNGLDADDRQALADAVRAAERSASADSLEAPRNAWVRASIERTERRGLESLRQRRTDTLEPARSEFPPAIDIHLHDKFPGGPFPPFDTIGYERSLEANGVVAGISSSATAIFHDLAKGNDENEALVRRVPRLRGYVVVDPRYLEDSIAELDRLDDRETWVGVKVHCAHAQTPTGSPAMASLMAAVAERGLPILVHPLGDDWPEALLALARRHSHLPIIAAHAGYGDAPHPTHDAALRVAGEPNIVIEFCSTYLATGAIRRGIEAVGIERVLFGSDFPLISLEYMRIAYGEAELSAAEASSIYTHNALRLFPALATTMGGKVVE